MYGEHMRTCDRCNTPYDWRRSSSSSLKMTYCGVLCERGGLGFTIESLLRGPLTEVRPEWRMLMAA